jgi:hypothetical protein
MGRGVKRGGERGWGEPRPFSSADLHKWDYAVRTCAGEAGVDGSRSSAIDPEISDALAWEASLQPREIMQKREAMISQIEEADTKMKLSGLRNDWLAAADAGVRGVVAEANGELFEQLAARSGFRDAGAAPLLREGAPFTVVVEGRL